MKTVIKSENLAGFSFKKKSHSYFPCNLHSNALREFASVEERMQ
jgi:hypothetical protein